MQGFEDPRKGNDVVGILLGPTRTSVGFGGKPEWRGVGRWSVNHDQPFRTCRFCTGFYTGRVQSF
jgi:hypothetical protein